MVISEYLVRFDLCHKLGIEIKINRTWFLISRSPLIGRGKHVNKYSHAPLNNRDEKCIVRWFCHCADTIEFGDGTALCTPRLCSIPPALRLKVSRARFHTK